MNHKCITEPITTFHEHFCILNGFFYQLLIISKIKYILQKLSFPKYNLILETCKINIVSPFLTTFDFHFFILNVAPKDSLHLFYNFAFQKVSYINFFSFINNFVIKMYSYNQKKQKQHLFFVSTK